MNFNQVKRYDENWENRGRDDFSYDLWECHGVAEDPTGEYAHYDDFKALQDDFLLLLKATSKMHSFKDCSEAAKEGEEQFLALLEKYRDNL